MEHKHTLYTVQRITKDDRLYGPTHGSCDGESIICDDSIELGSKWYIINNTFDGEITCKKCLKVLENAKCYQDLYGDKL